MGAAPPIMGLVAAASVIAGNVLVALAGQPGIGAAIDTVILAVLVIILDHIRETERKDRARNRTPRPRRRRP